MSNLDSPYRWDRDTGVFRKLLREAEIAARSRPGGIPEVLGTFLEYSEQNLKLLIFSLFIDSYPPPPGTQDLDPGDRDAGSGPPGARDAGSGSVSLLK